MTLGHDSEILLSIVIAENGSVTTVVGKIFIRVCVTPSAKPGQMDRLMSVYVRRKL